MRIGSRIYPYPVLNKEVQYSGYNPEQEFSLNIALNDNKSVFQSNRKIILKNVSYSLSVPELQQLIDDEKAKAYVIVESPITSVRHKFEVSQKPVDIELSKGDLLGDVEVSSYIVATQNIEGFYSDSFLDVYKDYTFDVDKYSVLAADDGFKFKVKIEEVTDNKVSSIFTIIAALQNNDDIIRYSDDGSFISIYMSQKYKEAYETLKSSTNIRSTVFAMLVIPPLASCIENLKHEYKDAGGFEELVSEHRWFKSVMASYEKDRNETLSWEDFDLMTGFELAQIVMGYSSATGLETFADLMINGNGDDGREED